MGSDCQISATYYATFGQKFLRLTRCLGANRRVGLSFPDNLGRVPPAASWSDSAARSVIHATRFRSGRTVSCIPIAIFAVKVRQHPLLNRLAGRNLSEVG